MYYAQDAPLKEIKFSTFYYQRKNRADIPLTQTGEVRQEVVHRMNVKGDCKYRKNCINLMPNTSEDYKRLCKVFASGFTHAVHVNKVMHHVKSFDIC